MGRVLKNARIQKAATSVFVLKAFFQLVSHMEQSVLPRVRTWPLVKEEKSSQMFFIKTKP